MLHQYIQILIAIVDRILSYLPAWLTLNSTATSIFYTYVWVRVCSLWPSILLKYSSHKFFTHIFYCFRFSCLSSYLCWIYQHLFEAFHFHCFVQHLTHSKYSCPSTDIKAPNSSSECPHTHTSVVVRAVILLLTNTTQVHWWRNNRVKHNRIATLEAVLSCYTCMSLYCITVSFCSWSIFNLRYVTAQITFIDIESFFGAYTTCYEK